MSRFRLERLGQIVLLTAALILGTECVSSAQVFHSGGTYIKTVVVGPNAITFTGSADSVYVNMPGAGPEDGAFALVSAPGTLVTVTFSAETQCAGGGTDPGWCGVRVLVDGSEAHPAPADFAFDSTNSGAEGSASWEGHAMQRHFCVPREVSVVNLQGAIPLWVPIQVQWRVFSSDGDTSAPSFRVDDWSLTIESAPANCGS